MWKRLTALSAMFIGITAEFVVFDRRDNPPLGFTTIGPTSSGEVLTLRFALPSNNMSGLHESVYDVSTPGSARYGKYLTREEVQQFVAPSADTVSQVNSWLASSNLTATVITPAGDWISVNMTVAQANTLLSADFSTFQNDKTNETVVRTLSYSIPSPLKTSIDWVHPTITFPQPRNNGFPSFINQTSTPNRVSPATATASISPDCRENSSWAVPCIQQLYEIPSTPAEPAANVLAVSAFDNSFSNERDLKTFLELYRPDMNPNTTFGFLSVDGGINNQLPAGAGFNGANPDVQLTVGLATGVPVTFISTGNLQNDFFAEHLDQTNYLVSLEHPPQTLLNTWMAELESSEITLQVATSLCNAYAQLAARGVSIIVQTGLEGAGGVHDLPDCKPFQPPFAATCPFVTAVGATEFFTDDPEETASPGSGGGFSTFFPRPRYQDTTVSAYLEATNNTDNTAFNVSGRAVPDVSAIFFADFIWDQEIFNFLATTEVSAAIFASMVALLTNERIAAGKPGLGFLNPLIYANPGAFNDVTTGSTQACGIPGFNSTVGWDPVTGFGSPSYPRLQEICRKL